MSNGGETLLGAIKDFFSAEDTPEELELKRAGEAAERAEEHVATVRQELDRMLEALGESIGDSSGESPAKIHRVLEHAVRKMDKIEEQLVALKKAQRAEKEASAAEDRAQEAVTAAREKK